MKGRDKPLYSNKQDISAIRLAASVTYAGRPLSVLSIDDWSASTLSTAILTEAVYGKPDSNVMVDKKRVLAWENVHPYSMILQSKKYSKPFPYYETDQEGQPNSETINKGVSEWPVISKLSLSENMKEPIVSLVLSLRSYPELYNYLQSEQNQRNNPLISISDPKNCTVTVRGKHYHGALVELFTRAVIVKHPELVGKMYRMREELMGIVHAAVCKTLLGNSPTLDGLLYSIEQSFFDNMRIGSRMNHSGKYPSRLITIDNENKLVFSHGPSFESVFCGGNKGAPSIILYKTNRTYSASLKPISICALKIYLDAGLRPVYYQSYSSTQAEEKGVSASFHTKFLSGLKDIAVDDKEKPERIDFVEWALQDRNKCILVPFDDAIVESAWVQQEFNAGLAQESKSVVVEPSRLDIKWPKMFANTHASCNVLCGAKVFGGVDPSKVLSYMSSLKICPALTKQFCALVTILKGTFRTFGDLVLKICWNAQYIMDPIPGINQDGIMSRIVACVKPSGIEPISPTGETDQGQNDQGQSDQGQSENGTRQDNRGNADTCRLRDVLEFVPVADLTVSYDLLSSQGLTRREEASMLGMVSEVVSYISNPVGKADLLPLYVNREVDWVSDYCIRAPIDSLFGIVNIARDSNKSKSERDAKARTALWEKFLDYRESIFGKSIERIPYPGYQQPSIDRTLNIAANSSNSRRCNTTSPPIDESPTEESTHEFSTASEWRNARPPKEGKQPALRINENALLSLLD